jgi:hypothetical protein
LKEEEKSKLNPYKELGQASIGKSCRKRKRRRRRGEEGRLICRIGDLRHRLPKKNFFSALVHLFVYTMKRVKNDISEKKFSTPFYDSLYLRVV